MPEYTDEDLNEAIQKVKNGKSVIKAANQHSVPRSSPGWSSIQSIQFNRTSGGQKINK
jgi:hypothetical protein